MCGAGSWWTRRTACRRGATTSGRTTSGWAGCGAASPPRASWRSPPPPRRACAGTSCTSSRYPHLTPWTHFSPSLKNSNLKIVVNYSLSLSFLVALLFYMLASAPFQSLRMRVNVFLLIPVAKWTGLFSSAFLFHFHILIFSLLSYISLLKDIFP